MERLTKNLKVLWRSERILRAGELRLTAKRIQLNAAAGLVAIMGLAMLTVASFLFLKPVLGEAWAALAVAVGDLVLAGALIAIARSLKAPQEAALVEEVRDMALEEIEAEVALAEAELRSMRDDVRRLVRNPFETLLPGLGTLIISGALSGLKTEKGAQDGQFDGEAPSDVD